MISILGYALGLRCGEKGMHMSGVSRVDGAFAALSDEADEPLCAESG